jgi:hypothetical protein
LIDAIIGEVGRRLVGVLLKVPGMAILDAIKHEPKEFSKDGLAMVVGVFAWVFVALIAGAVYMAAKNGTV